jgi:anti-sigma regulatory factor (Ser/Thr protein kinase)
MCRYDSKVFDAEVSESRTARRWVVRVLERWELAGAAEELELACSELVTNALLHTRSGFEVTIAVCSGAIELVVRDRDPRPPVLRPPRLDLLADIDTVPAVSEAVDDSELPGAVERHPSLHVGPAGSIAAGRGLIIVDAIADEWGVATHSAGKDVWLRLPVPAEWPYLHDCDCDELAPRTASGYPVRHLHGHWDSGHAATG